ncbi:MAG: hypothetical protein P1U46_00080 [Patescibacteria group bacterium]|nr:hypothetical protein [Patescibacteria group bacterium]
MKNKNYYVFDLSLSDLSCDKEKVDLYFLKDDLSIKTYLNIYKKSDLYMMFLDFSDLKISNYIYSLNSKIDNNCLKTQESYLNKFSLERKKTE